MELLQKYWWVALGVLALLFVAMRSRSGGGSLTQIGGGSEGLAYAQLDTQTALAENAQRYDFVSGLLNYGLETERIGRADALERLRIGSNERVAVQTAQYGNAAQQSALTAANYQANLQYQAALQALNNQRSQQNTQTWLQAIFGGFDRLAPVIFGQSGGGGFGGFGGGGYGGFGGGTPGIFPSGSWTWGF